MKAREDFLAVVPNSNFLTPHVLDYEFIGHYIVELSRGLDLDNQYIYGVTVVNNQTHQHEHELSRLFGSRRGAKYYINKLKELK